MPKGNPKPSTLRSTRYQKKAGYSVKSFKLKGDVAERFAKACETAGESQAAVISRLMEDYITHTIAQTPAV